MKKLILPLLLLVSGSLFAEFTPPNDHIAIPLHYAQCETCQETSLLKECVHGNNKACKTLLLKSYQRRLNTNEAVVLLLFLKDQILENTKRKKAVSDAISPNESLPTMDQSDK
jgi:hypothetical protein